MTEAIEKTEAVSESPKPYTFRKLSAEDMFLMFRILGKIGIRELKNIFNGEDMKALLESFGQGADQNADSAKALTAIGVSVGFEAVDIIMRNLPRCEEEIYQLLAQTSNREKNAIRKDAILFAEMLVDFVKKEEFPDFIAVVSRLFK